MKLGLGVVRFTADTDTAYKLCLWSRLAPTRIMLYIYAVVVDASTDVYEVASTIDGSEYMQLQQSLAVECVGKHPTIDNTQFGAMRIKDAIVDQFRANIGDRPNVDRLEPDVRFQLRMEKNQFYFVQDFSGPSLHQRGYRKEQGEAPLKEHLAAALLIRSGWQFDQSLLDPFCGSGTLLIEAVLMARNIAPGLKRPQFAFEKMADFDSSLWQQLRAEALGCTQSLTAWACVLLVLI